MGKYYFTRNPQMKISRIPNFGTFGVYVDDINMDSMSSDQWQELGELFAKELVLIFRNININKPQFADWIPKWGPLKADLRMRFRQKYGSDFDATRPDTWTGIDQEDRNWLEGRAPILEETGDGRFLTRIYGRKDGQGRAQGYFSHGEVHWHANESSSLTFSPAVALLGWESMETSATCFLQTVDLYESLSESFRSELNEMVLVHKYIPGRMNENEFTDPMLALHMKMAFCPVDGAETPLICTAPNGRRGLRYTVNSCASIKGMSEDDTQKLFDTLDKLVFDEKWTYNHWYQAGRRDMCCFDNSVTLHKRLGGLEDRKGFRMQFDLSPVIDHTWTPWQHMPEYHTLYTKQMKDLVNVYGGDVKERVKVPELA